MSQKRERRKDRKQRKRVLQRKTRQAKDRPKTQPKTDICSCCGEPYSPKHPDDEFAFGFFEFPDEAFEIFDDCDEAFYLPNGVMFKFYPALIVVRAPEVMRETDLLYEMIAESTISYYSDLAEYNAIYDRQGQAAALEYFDGDDIELDLDYWAE